MVKPILHIILFFELIKFKLGFNQHFCGWNFLEVDTNPQYKICQVPIVRTCNANFTDGVLLIDNLQIRIFSQEELKQAIIDNSIFENGVIIDDDNASFVGEIPFNEECPQDFELTCLTTIPPALPPVSTKWQEAVFSVDPQTVDCCPDAYISKREIALLNGENNELIGTLSVEFGQDGFPIIGTESLTGFSNMNADFSVNVAYTNAGYPKGIQIVNPETYNGVDLVSIKYVQRNYWLFPEYCCNFDGWTDNGIEIICNANDAECQTGNFAAEGLVFQLPVFDPCDDPQFTLNLICEDKTINFETILSSNISPTNGAIQFGTGIVSNGGQLGIVNASFWNSFFIVNGSDETLYYTSPTNVLPVNPTDGAISFPSDQFQSQAGTVRFKLEFYYLLNFECGGQASFTRQVIFDVVDGINDLNNIVSDILIDSNGNEIDPSNGSISYQCCNKVQFNLSEGLTVNSVSIDPDLDFDFDGNILTVNDQFDGNLDVTIQTNCGDLTASVTLPRGGTPCTNGECPKGFICENGICVIPPVYDGCDQKTIWTDGTDPLTCESLNKVLNTTGVIFNNQFFDEIGALITAVQDYYYAQGAILVQYNQLDCTWCIKMKDAVPEIPLIIDPCYLLRFSLETIRTRWFNSSVWFLMSVDIDNDALSSHNISSIAYTVEHVSNTGNGWVRGQFTGSSNMLYRTTGANWATEPYIIKIQKLEFENGCSYQDLEILVNAPDTEETFNPNNL